MQPRCARTRPIILAHLWLPGWRLGRPGAPAPRAPRAAPPRAPGECLCRKRPHQCLHPAPAEPGRSHRGRNAGRNRLAVSSAPRQRSPSLSCAVRRAGECTAQRHGRPGGCSPAPSRRAPAPPCPYLHALHSIVARSQSQQRLPPAVPLLHVGAEAHGLPRLGSDDPPWLVQPRAAAIQERLDETRMPSPAAGEWGAGDGRAEGAPGLWPWQRGQPSSRARSVRQLCGSQAQLTWRPGRAHPCHP